MAKHTLQDLRAYGIHGETFSRVHSQGMAADATLVTAPNIGVPQEFLTYLDNEVVNILTAKRAARDIGREVKKGDATTTSARFPVVESIGSTDPYNDFADGGTANMNANWPVRENYLFSTTRQYGDLEEARNSAAKINLAAQTQQSAASIIDVDVNFFYFFGVKGLKNYGILNDPALPAAIAPLPSGTNNSPLWDKKSAKQIYDDIIRLFQQLVDQTGGNVDEKSPLVLALSPSLAALLAGLNDLGNRNVLDMLKGYFTNLRIVSAVQYSTGAGEMMQLICTQLEAQDTVWLGFSEKFYAFAPVRKTSSYIQKFRAGTFGAIIRRPVAVAAMLGM